MASPLDRKDKLINDADELFFGSLAGIDNELAKEIIKIYAGFVVGSELVFNADQLAQLEDSILW